MRQFARGRVGGLRGPGLSTDDQDYLDATAMAATASAVAAARAYESTGLVLDTVSEPREVVVSERAATNGFAAGTFTKWSAGFQSGAGLDVADGTFANSITLRFAYSAAATKTEAFIVQRDIDDPQFDTAAPGDAASDVTFHTFSDQNLADLGITPGGPQGDVPWVLPFGLRFDPDKAYAIVTTANEGAAYLAPQTNQPATGIDSAWRRGWFWFGASADSLEAGEAVALTIRTIRREMRPIQRRQKNTATRTFCGERTEYALDNTTPKTFRAVMALARGFEAVRVLFAHAGPSEIEVGRCAVGVIDDPDNYACAGVTWHDATFDGAAGGSIVSRPAGGRRGWGASDWIAIDSAERADNPEKCPLIAISAYVPSAATLTLMGNADASHDYTGWASHPDRPIVFRQNEGDCVTTPASFTSTVNRSSSPIVGVQYRANGRVLTLGGLGDSITANPLGWLFKAALRLSGRAIAFETMNLAWAGSTPDTFDLQFLDMLGLDLYPDACFMPNASPNSGAVPLTDAVIGDMDEWALRTLRLLQSYAVTPIPWTMLPVNPTVHDYGASDEKRRDHNDVWRAMAGEGITVADFADKLAGVTDGDGQQLILAGRTLDGIHPNDTGDEDLADVAEAAAAAAGVYTPGSLVTV